MNGRLSSMSLCKFGSIREFLNGKNAPTRKAEEKADDFVHQMRMATARKESWQPILKISVGLAMITKIQARAKVFAGSTRRRNQTPAQHAAMTQAARITGGRPPVITA